MDDMYFYKRLLDSDMLEAFAISSKNQKKFKKLANAILLFSMFAGLILWGIVSVIYGEDTGGLFFIGGWVGYMLGYHYCKALWDKDKDSNEFSKAMAMRKYEKEISDRTT